MQLEVWDSYTKLKEAGQAVEAAQALVASATETLKVTEGEYKNGMVSMVDVIDAQTALSNARLKLVQARLDWFTEMAELERATGRMLTGIPDSEDRGGMKD